MDNLLILECWLHELSSHQCGLPRSILHACLSVHLGSESDRNATSSSFQCLRCVVNIYTVLFVYEDAFVLGYFLYTGIYSIYSPSV